MRFSVKGEEASDGSGTLFYGLSKSEGSGHCIRQEREQVLQDKRLKAQERAVEKARKKEEAGMKPDERAAAAATRDANGKKAAVQRAREARKAHKHTKVALQATTQGREAVPRSS